MKLLRRDFLHSMAATVGVAFMSQEGFAPPADGSSAVTYDSRSVVIHGKRELLVIGEMHYTRSTREQWPHILDRSHALGVNCIATYVFWNMHEPKRGVFDFSGDSDLGHFLELCRERGLYVFLRTGPYCCAEWNFGGFPSWLRDEPGITLRTMSPPYLRRVEIYFEQLAQVVRPMLASSGGPIILVQVENEYANVAKRYGEAGQEYLRWMVDLSKRVGLQSVPTTTCEGGAPGAIETANGNVIPPAHVQDMLAKYPDAPPLWSELHPAWYQIWGGVRPKTRLPQEMASAILSFVGAGGAGWNYYMWYGGTNFGRNSMYLQMTSYDFDAPLDEFGRETMLGFYLGRLHRSLRENQDLILTGNRVRNVAASGAVLVTWTSEATTLLLIENPTAQKLTIEGRTLLPGASSLSLGEKVVFDTEVALVGLPKTGATWNTVASAFTWSAYREPLPQHRPDAGTMVADPVEQLLLTRDQTDYCWYSTSISVDSASESKLDIPYGGDFLYVFVDGRLVAQSQAPFYENRGYIVPESPQSPRIVANIYDTEHVDGYSHRFDLGSLTTGQHRLDLLCVSMGLIKGDWQIGYPMNYERKGIWAGVLLNGESLHDWQMRSHLTGERIGLAAGDMNHATFTSADQAQPLTWYKAEFRVDASMLAGDADYRIDADGMGKGALFINGKSIGRYWLIEAQGSVLPSQRYYHVPRNWLGEYNTVVVFEEQAYFPSALKLDRRVGTL
jgi:beta-galactosidase